MQFLTNNQLQYLGVVKSRWFDFNFKQFIHPYERFMMDDEPIHQHLTTLYFIAREFNCKTILEFGVKEGYSTSALASACKETGGHLYSCDITKVPKAFEKINELGLDKYWTFNQMDSKKFVFDKEIDLLFIDSEHSAPQVEAELRLFEPKVKSGGFIVLHDIAATYRESLFLKAIESYFKEKNYESYRWFNDCGLMVVRKP